MEGIAAPLLNVIVREVTAKSVLTKSGIPGADYCINPYIGCSHGCRYCYATFMKKYTGHMDEWGSFVDVKINAPDVLGSQLKRVKRRSIIISSVTDAYQPIEEQYRLTRRCLEVLLDHQFPVDILTKSPLVLRDLDLIRRFQDIEVGITVTTDKEHMRKVFEPRAPRIEERITALKTLRDHGVRTYAFIGPLLPMDPESLCEKIRGYVDHVFIDGMNYVSKTADVYKRLNLSQWLDKGFLQTVKKKLKSGFEGNAALVC